MSAPLLSSHLTNLRASGLTDATIAAAGLYSADETALRALLGFGGCGAGLVFPYDGTYFRARIDRPGPDQKRYRAPAGKGNRLYLAGLRGSPEVLTDPSIPLYITEGEKKTLAACQAGYPTVGVAGVWSWKTKLHGRSLEIADLDRITWQRRRVILVFDSDAEQKPDVSWAEHQLAQTLLARGANVFVIRLPDQEDGTKQGWDDFLVRSGRESFGRLEMVSALGSGEEEAPEFLRVSDLQDAYIRAARSPAHRLKLGIDQDMDSQMRGVAEGEVLVVMGRSGVGKTAVLLNLIEHMSAGVHPTLMFSLEMQGVELFERLVSMSTGLGGREVEELARLDEGALAKTSLPMMGRWQQVVTVDRPCKLSRIDDLIGRAQRAGLWTEPLRIVAIDYLGMISPEGEGGKTYEIISKLAREIKRLAKKHRIRVLLLCQVSREGGSGGEPITMSMARDSGAIEESADHILGLWRPELYTYPGWGKHAYTEEQKAALQGVMIWKLLKHRNGPAPLTFEMRFETPSLAITRNPVKETVAA